MDLFTKTIVALFLHFLLHSPFWNVVIGKFGLDGRLLGCARAEGTSIATFFFNLLLFILFIIAREEHVLRGPQSPPDIFFFKDYQKSVPQYIHLRQCPRVSRTLTCILSKDSAPVHLPHSVTINHYEGYLKKKSAPSHCSGSPRRQVLSPAC